MSFNFTIKALSYIVFGSGPYNIFYGFIKNLKLGKERVSFYYKERVICKNSISG